jgi:hypothetical protein
VSFLSVLARPHTQSRAIRAAGMPTLAAMTARLFVFDNQIREQNRRRPGQASVSERDP